MASRSLGVLSLDLVAKTGAFIAGMTKAERSTQKSSRAMRREMEDLRKTAVKVGAVFGTALVGATALIIKNTADAAREQAQLGAVLKSTGGVAGQTQAELNKMADGLQQVSTFSAGSITEMQSLLLTFTNLRGDVFPKAQQAVLDMATALGTDLRQQALQLGKALNDPMKGVTALGRAGVQFSEDQKEMIKSLVEAGDVAKAQELILAELEVQFGGSARAASDTLGGALTILKNNFNDLLEGDSQGEGVKGATQAIRELAALLKSPEVQEGFASIVSGAATATGKLAELISTAAGLSRFLGEEFAARVGGPSAEDTVRVVQRIERLKTTMDALKNTSLTNPLAFMDASELIPSDLLGTTKSALARLQAELDKEENKLKLGIALNTAAAFGAQAATGGTPMEAGGNTVITGGAGFGAGDPVAMALGSRADAAREAAAALKALGDQERAEAEAAQKLAEKVYEQQADLRAKAAEEAEQPEAALAPGRELVDNLKFELELMKMTNAERAVAIQLRGLDEEAVRKYGAEIKQLNADIEANIQVAEGMDVVRDATRGLFSDLMDGSKSAKDAFKDFVDGILDGIAQIVARNLTESLFGSLGSTGDGSGGGFLSSLFGSLFGGARASGGPVYPGKAYLVGEEGPELIRPMGAGMVSTAGETARMGRGSASIVNNFNMPGRYDMRTQAQIASDTGRSTQRALARGTA